VLFHSCIANIQSDSGALTLLTLHFTAGSTRSTYTLPPPSHLAILTTMLVHPTTTDTPARQEASHLLSRVLDVASPQTAKFYQVWEFGRKRKRREEFYDDGDETLNILNEESLFTMTTDVWDVIEWAFYQSHEGWIDLMGHVVRILRNDFDLHKGSHYFCMLITEAKTIDECLFAKWLRDRNDKASITKAVRAVTATPNGVMMLDIPRPIYPKELERKGQLTSADIWGGSIALSQRIELLTLVFAHNAS
jgi:hypothetical protein